MSSQHASAPRTAAAPFHGAAGSDIILRSSDGVDFHAHRLILSLASPVFETMFTLPQPPSDTGTSANVKPIIDVTEPSKTVDALLRTCYPALPAALNGVEDIVDVLEAAIKYEMDHASTTLRTRFRELVPHNPLYAWALVCHRSRALEEEAEIAAQAWRSSGYKPEPKDVAEIDALPALTYKHLLMFQHGIFVPSFCAAPSNPPPPLTIDSGDPFTYADADIALRSSDGVIFRIHSLVLSLMSAPFATLACRARSSAERDNGLPIIGVAEDSRTMWSILYLCYPGTDGVLVVGGLIAIRRLLFAGRKYAVKRVEEWVKARLGEYIGEGPLSVYYMAAAHGWNALAREAAFHYLERVTPAVKVEPHWQGILVEQVDDWLLQAIPALHLRKLCELEGSTILSILVIAAVYAHRDGGKQRIRRVLRDTADKIDFYVDP